MVAAYSEMQWFSGNNNINKNNYQNQQGKKLHILYTEDNGDSSSERNRKDGNKNITPNWMTINANKGQR